MYFTLAKLEDPIDVQYITENGLLSQAIEGFMVYDFSLIFCWPLWSRWVIRSEHFQPHYIPEYCSALLYETRSHIIMRNADVIVENPAVHGRLSFPAYFQYHTIQVISRPSEIGDNFIMKVRTDKRESGMGNKH